MIASISEEMDYYGVASRKPDSGDIEMALRCVPRAPPILMQLFSLGMQITVQVLPVYFLMGF